eukprot:GHUV01026699.1.p1 GENE.GHUV01026699.1~~GHUV01026699.1.p1  ORF type:complete len:492 (+),score=86.58 GHUV01026699.1:819-2294(+)
MMTLSSMRKRSQLHRQRCCSRHMQHFQNSLRPSCSAINRCADCLIPGAAAWPFRWQEPTDHISRAWHFLQLISQALVEPKPGIFLLQHSTLHCGATDMILKTDSGMGVVTTVGHSWGCLAAYPQCMLTAACCVQGMSVGCKPTVALIKYMESSGATVQQLQQQLAPLIAAEQAFSYTGSLSGCTAEASTSTGVLAAPGQGLPGMQSADQQGLAAPAAQHAEMSGLAPLQQQLKKKHPQQIQPLQQQPQQPMHDQQQQPCIARLLSNIELVQETLSGMNQWDGFKQVAWGNLEMWYSHDTVNQRQLVKARTVLDEPIVHAVCLAREFDLVPSWNPAILDSRELKAYSPSELLIYILSWCPWPLPCGEVLNYALGVDLLDTKDRCVLLATNTPSEEQLQSIAVPQHPRTLRMIMHAGGFKFIPLPPDPAKPNVQRMEAIVLMSMDAKKFVIPDTIISFLLKIFAPLVYKSVMKVLGSIFHQKNGRLPSGLWCT